MFHEIVEREFIAFAWGTVVFESGFKPGHDFGVVLGEVVGFGGVFFKVVELPVAGCFGFRLLADGFPREVDDGKLSAVAMKFPNHGLGAFEGTFGERGSEIGAVEILGCFGFGDGAESGEPVGEVGRGGSGGAGLNLSRPADNGRDADSAFIDGALPAPEAGGGVEEGGIYPADVKFWIAAGMGGAVVGGEDDDGVVIETELLESVEDRANMLVEIGDHGGIARSRARVGDVSVLSAIGAFFFIPLLWIAVDPFLGRMHRDVGFDEREVEEEGLVLVGVEEFESFFKNAVGRVSLIAVVVGLHFPLWLAGVTGDGVLVDGFGFFVVIQEGGEEGVGVALAVVAVEASESLPDGGAGGVGGAETPFPKSSADVSTFLKGFRKSDRFGGDGPLTGEFATVFRISV